MRPAGGLWIGLTLAVAPGVRAEPVYVIEQLMVNVVSAPSGGERVATVKSGDRLELLERQNDEAHVRLASGAEGWVRASYLSSERPLQQRLTERGAEIEKLKADVSRLESELSAARVASTPAPPARAPAESVTGVAGNSSSTGSRSNEPGALRDADGLLVHPERSAHPSWLWVLGAAMLMLLLGFALGWRTLDQRIRRKYGGLRIY